MPEKKLRVRTPVEVCFTIIGIEKMSANLFELHKNFECSRFLSFFLSRCFPLHCFISFIIQRFLSRSPSGARKTSGSIGNFDPEENLIFFDHYTNYTNYTKKFYISGISIHSIQLLMRSDNFFKLIFRMLLPILPVNSRAYNRVKFVQQYYKYTVPPNLQNLSVCATVWCCSSKSFLLQ